MKEKVSDNQLIQNFLNGDQDAFKKLHQRYKSLVYSCIYKYTTDKNDLKDFSQDIWLKVILKLKMYKPENGYFSGWLKMLSVNVCKDKFRRKTVANKTINGYKNELKDDFYNIDVDKYIYDTDLIKRIIDKLEKLNPTQRDVILLRLHNVKFEKISQILSKKMNTCLSASRVGMAFLKKKTKKDIRLYKATL